MDHIVSIRYSADAHLGWFRILAIVDHAAVNVGVHVSFWIMVYPGYMPSSGLLGHEVILFLVF